jgi:hypothetical protein
VKLDRATKTKCYQPVGFHFRVNHVANREVVFSALNASCELELEAFSISNTKSSAFGLQAGAEPGFDYRGAKKNLNRIKSHGIHFF